MYLDDADRERLDPILDACVPPYKEQIDEDGQVDFKGTAKALLRTYVRLPRPDPPLQQRQVGEALYYALSEPCSGVHYVCSSNQGNPPLSPCALAYIRVPLFLQNAIPNLTTTLLGVSMLSSFVVTLREGLEAALIVGLILATIRRTGAGGLRRPVWLGVAGALALSLLGGIAFGVVVGELPEDLEETVEGVATVVAVGVLTFMVFWMRDRAAKLAESVRSQVVAAAGISSGLALGLLSFTSVLREGLETALFLYASLTGTSTAAGVLGAFLGVTVAVALGYGLYRGTLHLDLGRFFAVTGVLLLLFAAGLLAGAVAEIQESGASPALVPHLWSTAGLLPDDSGVGRVLRDVLGYRATPSLLQVVAYWLYLLGVGGLYFRGLRRSSLPPVSGPRPAVGGSH